jgi:2-methylisocitrate lyase-like PEP mutase family enzyme
VKQSDVRMATRLRQFIASPGLIRAVNIYDPLSARIAERLGFRVVALGGFQLAAQLCTPEPLLTMTEVINSARNIVQAVNIPLKVDCGAGFGDPIHVMRTVREAEAAGIACIHIEDQLFPKRVHYHRGIEHVISSDEMIDKIKAAVAARHDADFVIVGRTDAMRTDGIHEGIRRSNLYAEAGCDMVEIFPNNLEEVRLAPKEIHAPVIYVNSPGNRLGRPVCSWRELEENGYKMVLDSTTAMLAAAQSIHETFSVYMREERPPLDRESSIRAREWLETILGLPDYYGVEEKTTESGKEERKK